MTTRPISRLGLRSGALATLVAGSTLLVSGSAAAQYSLGSGQALDRNLRVGGDLRNLPRAVENYAVRNALITGNVAGGREFRGNVGYTSDRAFRGAAGSDDNFRFRADSALSALPAVLGGATSDRYSIAGSQALLQFDRDTTTSSIDIVQEIGGADAQMLDLRAMIDRASLQGSTSRVFERSSDGAVIGGLADDRGRQLAVMASPTVGMRFEEVLSDATSPIEVGLFDWRRINEDRAAGRLAATSSFQRLGSTEPASGFAVTPGAMSAELNASPGRVEGTEPNVLATTPESVIPPSERLDLRQDAESISRDYDAIVARILEQFGETVDIRVQGDPALRARLGEALEALRADLALGGLQPPVGSGTDGVAPADPNTPLGPDGRPLEPLPGALAPEFPNELPPDAPAGEGEPAAEAPKVDPATPPTLDELARALRHGRTVEDLSSEEKSRIGELISRGQEQFTSGDYFFAEQSFDRALRILPGQPMATAGLVHTQLAAGLYLSAAINLRRFFTAMPEMIDTRYSAELLPPPERVKAATAMIRKLMETNSTDRPTYGLSLAYLGFQSKDTPMIREGLDAIVGGEGEDTLRQLLKRIWLDE